MPYHPLLKQSYCFRTKSIKYTSFPYEDTRYYCIHISYCSISGRDTKVQQQSVCLSNEIHDLMTTDLKSKLRLQDKHCYEYQQRLVRSSAGNSAQQNIA